MVIYLADETSEEKEVMPQFSKVRVKRMERSLSMYVRTLHALSR